MSTGSLLVNAVPVSQEMPKADKDADHAELRPQADILVKYAEVLGDALARARKSMDNAVGLYEYSVYAEMTQALNKMGIGLGSMPEDWHKTAFKLEPDPEPGEAPRDYAPKPLYKLPDGSVGEVKRIITLKYEGDVDLLRCGSQVTPSATEIGAQLATEVAKLGGDKSGWRWCTRPVASVRVHAYMIEMFLYMYAVDVPRTEA